MKANLIKFTSLQEASEKLLSTFTSILNQKQVITAAMPGGTTPVKFYELLANAPIEWENVNMVLSDERWVDVHADDSNEKQLSKYVPLKRAGFISLKTSSEKPEDALPELERRLKKLPKFDLVILGMGDDGHFASVFPGKVNSEIGNFNIARPANLQKRISLAPSKLLNSEKIIILISGPKKLAVIEEINAGGGANFPVSAIINQGKTPVEIFWSEK